MIKSYKNYVDRFDPVYSPHGLVDGPLGQGRIDTNFYYNENNPDIPETNQATQQMIDSLYGEKPQLNKTTQHSLACIVVELGNYKTTFSAGKTRKRRQNKRNSRKRRN